MATNSARYRVQVEGLPAEEFGPEDHLADDHRPWSAERAWDCYKRKHPDSRPVRRRPDGQLERNPDHKPPTITAVEVDLHPQQPD